MDISNSGSKANLSTDVQLSLRSLPQQLQDQVSLSNHEFESQYDRLTKECHVHNIEQCSPKNANHMNSPKGVKTTFFGKTQLRQVENGTSFDASFSKYDDASTFGQVMHDDAWRGTSHAIARRSSSVGGGQEQSVVPPHISLPDTLPALANQKEWPEVMLQNAYAVEEETVYSPSEMLPVQTEDHKSSHGSLRTSQNSLNSSNRSSSISTEQRKSTKLLEQGSFSSLKDDTSSMHSVASEKTEIPPDINEYPTQREIHKRIVQNLRKNIHKQENTMMRLLDNVESCQFQEEYLNRQNQVQLSTIYAVYPEFVTSGNIFNDLIYNDYPQIQDSGLVQKDKMVHSLDIQSKETLDWEYRCDQLDLSENKEGTTNDMSIIKNAVPDEGVGVSVNTPMHFDSIANIVDTSKPDFIVHARELLLCDRDVELQIKDKMDTFLHTRAMELQKMLLKYTCNIQEQQNILTKRMLEHEQMKQIIFHEKVNSMGSAGIEQVLEQIVQDAWLELKSEEIHPLFVQRPNTVESNVEEDIASSEQDALVKLLSGAAEEDVTSVQTDVDQSSLFHVDNDTKAQIKKELNHVGIFPRIPQTLEDILAGVNEAYTSVKMEQNVPEEGVATGFEDILALFPDTVEDAVQKDAAKEEAMKCTKNGGNQFLNSLLEQHLQWPENPEASTDTYQWLRSSVVLGETQQQLSLSELSTMLLSNLQMNTVLPKSSDVPEDRQYDPGATHACVSEVLVRAMAKVHSFLILHGAQPDNNSVHNQVKKETAVLNELTGEHVLLHDTETGKLFTEELETYYRSIQNNQSFLHASLLDTENALSSSIKSACLSARQKGILGESLRLQELRRTLVDREPDAKFKGWKQSMMDRSAPDIRSTGPRQGVRVNSVGIAGVSLHPEQEYRGYNDRLLIQQSRVQVQHGDRPITYQCALDRYHSMHTDQLGGIQEYLYHVEQSNEKYKNCGTQKHCGVCQKCERAAWSKNIARGIEHVVYDIVCHNTTVQNITMLLHQSVKGFNKQPTETRAPIPLHTPALFVQYPSWVPLTPLESDISDQVRIPLPGELNVQLVLPTVQEASPCLVTMSIYHQLQHHGQTLAEEDPQIPHQPKLHNAKNLQAGATTSIQDALGSVLSLSPSQVKSQTVEVHSYNVPISGEFCSSYHRTTGLKMKGQFELKDQKTPVHKMVAAIDALYEAETDTSLQGLSALLYVQHTCGFSPLEVVLLYWFLQSSQNGVDPIQGYLHGAKLQAETRAHTLQVVQCLTLVIGHCTNSPLLMSLLQSMQTLAKPQKLNYDPLAQLPPAIKAETQARVSATMQWMGYTPESPLPVKLLPATAVPCTQPFYVQQMQHRQNNYSSVIKTSPFVEYFVTLKTRQTLKEMLLVWMEGSHMVTTHSRESTSRTMSLHFDHLCPVPVVHHNYLGYLTNNADISERSSKGYFGCYGVEPALTYTTHDLKHPWLLPVMCDSVQVEEPEEVVSIDSPVSHTAPQEEEVVSPSASFVIVEKNIVINTVDLFNETLDSLRTQIAKEVPHTGVLEDLTSVLLQPLTVPEKDDILEQLRGSIPIDVKKAVLPYTIPNSNMLTASAYGRDLITELLPKKEKTSTKQPIYTYNHIYSSGMEFHKHTDTLAEQFLNMEQTVQAADMQTEYEVPYINLDLYKMSGAFGLWEQKEGDPISEHHQGIPISTVQDILRGVVLHATSDSIVVDDQRDSSAHSTLKTMAHVLMYAQTHTDSLLKKQVDSSVKLTFVTSTPQPLILGEYLRLLTQRYLAFPQMYALLCCVQMDKTEAMQPAHVEQMQDFFPSKTRLPETLAQFSWLRTNKQCDNVQVDRPSQYSQLLSFLQVDVVQTMLLRRNSLPQSISSVHGDQFFGKSLFQQAKRSYITEYVNKYQVHLQKQQSLQLHKRTSTVLQTHSMFEVSLDLVQHTEETSTVNVTQQSKLTSPQKAQHNNSNNKSKIDMYQGDIPSYSRGNSHDSEWNASEERHSTVQIHITGENTLPNSVTIPSNNRAHHYIRAQPVNAHTLQKLYSHPFLSQSDYVLLRSSLIDSDTAIPTSNSENPNQEALSLRPQKSLHAPLVCSYWVISSYYDILACTSETLLLQHQTRCLASTVTALNTGMTASRTNSVMKNNFIGLANTYIKPPVLPIQPTLVEYLHYSVAHVKTPALAAKICKYPFYHYQSGSDENLSLLNINELLSYDYDDLLAHINNIHQVESLLTTQLNSSIPIIHNPAHTHDLFGSSTSINHSNSGSSIPPLSKQPTGTVKLRPAKTADKDIEHIPVAFQNPIPPLHSTIAIMEVNSRHIYDTNTPLTALRVACGYQTQFNQLAGSVFKYHMTLLQLHDLDTGIHLHTHVNTNAESESLQSIGRSFTLLNSTILKSLGLEQGREDIVQDLHRTEEQLNSSHSHVGLACSLDLTNAKTSSTIADTEQPNSWFYRVLQAKHVLQEVQAVLPVHINELSAVTMIHTGYMASSMWNTYNKQNHNKGLPMSPSLALQNMHAKLQSRVNYFVNFVTLHQQYVQKRNSKYLTLHQHMLVLGDTLEIAATPVHLDHWESLLPVKRKSLSLQRSPNMSPTKKLDLSGYNELNSSDHVHIRLQGDHLPPSEQPQLRKNTAPMLVSELPSLHHPLQTVSEIESSITTTFHGGNRTARGESFRSSPSRGRTSPGRGQRSPSKGSLTRYGSSFQQDGPCSCTMLLCCCDLTEQQSLTHADYLDSSDAVSFQALTSTSYQRLSIQSHSAPLDLLRHQAYTTPSAFIMQGQATEMKCRHAQRNITDTVTYATTVMYPKEVHSYHTAIPSSQRISSSIPFLNVFLDETYCAYNQAVNTYKACKTYTINVQTQLEYPRMPNRRISAVLFSALPLLPVERMYHYLRINELPSTCLFQKSNQNQAIETNVETVREGFNRVLLQFYQIILSLNQRVNSVCLLDEMSMQSRLLYTTVVRSNQNILEHLEQEERKECIDTDITLDTAATAITRTLMHHGTISRRAVDMFVTGIQSTFLPNNKLPPSVSQDAVLSRTIKDAVLGCPRDSNSPKNPAHVTGQLAYMYKHQSKLDIPQTLDTWRTHSKKSVIVFPFPKPSNQDIPVFQGQKHEGVSSLIPPSRYLQWKDATLSQEFKKIFVNLFIQTDAILFDQNTAHQYSKFITGESVLPLVKQTGNNVSISKVQKLAQQFNFMETSTNLSDLTLQAISTVAAMPTLEKSLVIKNNVCDYVFESINLTVYKTLEDGRDAAAQTNTDDISYSNLLQHMNSVQGLKKTIMHVQGQLPQVVPRAMPAFNNIVCYYISAYSAVLPYYSMVHMRAQTHAHLAEFVLTGLYQQYVTARRHAQTQLESIPVLLVEDFKHRKMTSEIVDASHNTENRPISSTTGQKKGSKVDAPSILANASHLGLLPQLFLLLKSVQGMEAWYYNPCISVVQNEAKNTTALTPQHLSVLPVSPHHKQTLFHVMERLHATGNIMEYTSVLLQVFFNIYQSEPSDAVLLEFRNLNAGQDEKTLFHEMTQSAWFTQQLHTQLGSTEDKENVRFPKDSFWKDVYPACMAFLRTTESVVHTEDMEDHVIRRYAVKKGIKMSSINYDSSPSTLQSLFTAESPDIEDLYTAQPGMPSLVSTSLSVCKTLPYALSGYTQANARGVAQHYLGLLQRELVHMQEHTVRIDKYVSRVLGSVALHALLLSKITSANHNLVCYNLVDPLHQWHYASQTSVSKDLMGTCLHQLGKQGQKLMMTSNVAAVHAKLKSICTGEAPKNASLLVISQLQRDTSILSLQTEETKAHTSWLAYLLQSPFVPHRVDEVKRRAGWANNRICQDMLVNVFNSLAVNLHTNNILMSSSAMLSVDTAAPVFGDITDSSACLAGLHAHIINSATFLGASMEKASTMEGVPYYVLHSRTFERVMKQFTTRQSMDQSAIDRTSCELGRRQLNFIDWAQSYVDQTHISGDHSLPRIDTSENMQELLQDIYQVQDVNLDVEALSPLPNQQERIHMMSFPYDNQVDFYSKTNVKTLEEVLLLHTANPHMGGHTSATTQRQFEISSPPLQVALPSPLRKVYTNLQFHQYCLQMNHQLFHNMSNYVQKHKTQSILTNSLYHQLHHAYNSVEKAHQNRVMLHHIQTLTQSNKMWLELQNRLVQIACAGVKHRVECYDAQEDVHSVTPLRDMQSLLQYNCSYTGTKQRDNTYVINTPSSRLSTRANSGIAELMRATSNARDTAQKKNANQQYQILFNGDAITARSSQRSNLLTFYHSIQDESLQPPPQYDVLRSFWDKLKPHTSSAVIRTLCTELIDTASFRSLESIRLYKGFYPVYLQIKAAQRARTKLLLENAQKLMHNLNRINTKEALVEEQAKEITKVGRFIEAARVLGNYDLPELDRHISVLQLNIPKPVKRTLTTKLTSHVTVSAPEQTVSVPQVSRINNRTSTQRIFNASAKLSNTDVVQVDTQQHDMKMTGPSYKNPANYYNTNNGTATLHNVNSTSSTSNMSSLSNMNSTSSKLNTPRKSTNSNNSNNTKMKRTSTVTTTSNNNNNNNNTSSITELPFYLSGTVVDILPTIQRNKTMNNKKVTK